MMPIEQRCPKCHKTFIGTDCVGRECIECELTALQSEKPYLEKEEVKVLFNQLTRAAVFAFREMNEIRARDGVPYTHMGCKSSVTEEHFSRVADMLDEAVKAATGKSAHCHPELYK